MFKIYCPKCGEKLPDGSKFCTKCGTPITLEAKTENIFQKFETNPNLQDHWVRRFLAYLIDFVIVSVAAGILLFIIRLPLYIANPVALIDPFIFPFAVGLILVPYSILIESYSGATIGKDLMGLKVVTESGVNPSFEQELIRNISKSMGF